MNALVQTNDSTALTLAERAVKAIAIDKTEAQLADLAASTASITTITNVAGYQQCHASRMVLKNQRVDIEKRGKAAREEAKDFVSAVIAAQKKLVGIIQPEEQRLQTIQDKWDAHVEADKKAKADAEKARIAAIHERMAELRGNQQLTSLHCSSLIAQHLEDLEALPADDSFEEFQEEAVAIKAGALARLSALLKAAEAREAEEKRLADERAAFERQQAEAQRVASIQSRINAIRGLSHGATQFSSQQLLALIERVSAIVIDDTFAEFREDAAGVRSSVLQDLESLRSQKLTHEADQARLAAERERLESQAAEQRRLQAIAEQEARAKREAEEAELARQREAIEAEKQRLAEESAAIERQRAAAQEIEVSGSVNAVEPDQQHGEGNAEIVASPGDGPRAASAAQVAQTVAPSLTSTMDLFDPRARPAAPADMPSADEIVFALMAEFGASREQVLEWLSSVNWELQD